MMASSRDRNRSSSWDGSGFGRIGCLLNQAEEHAIMNRIETEDSSYASARNRKLLAEWAAKAGENEYAEPALNPCQITAYINTRKREPIPRDPSLLSLGVAAPTSPRQVLVNETLFYVFFTGDLLGVADLSC